MGVTVCVGTGEGGGQGLLGGSKREAVLCCRRSQARLTCCWKQGSRRYQKVNFYHRLLENSGSLSNNHFHLSKW